MTTLERLKTFVNKRVSVCVVRTARNTFDPQISICGTLEFKAPNYFRVLIDKGTYTYFDSECVETMTMPDGIQSNQVGRFEDGSVVVIEINVKNELNQ